MTPEQLLHECEKLTHDGRMKRMVEVGRLASGDASVRKTLASFAQGDVYQRALATQACYGSRDSSQVLQALSDPSRNVRALAFRLVASICSDGELQKVLGAVSFDMKLQLLRKLHKHQRIGLIDSYLETLASHGDETLKDLLPFGSREIVVRYLRQISGRIDSVTLSRLTRQYPELVVEHLRTQASDTIDPRLVLQVNTVLPLISDTAPDLALDLVKALVAFIPLGRLNVQPLLSRRPNEIADLLLQESEQSGLRFDRVIQHLDTEHLLALFTRFPGSISTSCFPKLKPQQRLAIYTICERGWRNEEGVLPYYIVAALATPQRMQEGRRHLELPALAARHQERLRYAAFLLWDEARALLDTPLRSPDADLRAIALRALITTTRYQREHLADVLQLVRNHRNEQDPVRREMLSALAELPHGIWKQEHLTDLAQIIRDALNATDLSYATANAAERLVVHLFPFHPEWSAGQMAIVYRERGRISVYQLQTYVSDADIRRIAPVLTPILKTWRSRESDTLLVTLAVALGRRMRSFDELAELLEDTLKSTLLNGLASSILNLFVKHRRARIDLLIPNLLQHDKSAINLAPVYTYLHRHRQDLITPFLGQHAYGGRFSTGQTRSVLPLTNGFWRWLPSQQERFARTLIEVVRGKDRATTELLVTIKQLAAMPAINPAPLIRFASDERPLVRDAALRALGRLDAGQGIPTLMEALNDERARIAIYALRNALLSMPQEEALKFLRTVPLTQVTVAKEVVRLIGDLSSEVAYRELLAMEARDLHRDVHVALLRALWSYVERDETWEIFTRAAQAPEAALARGVVHIPEDGMSPGTQRRLATLTATLLAHPEPEVRIATLQWRSHHPLTDHEQVLFSRLITLMNSPIPDECAQAARAIFAIYTGNDAALVGKALQELLSNRRALQIALDAFINSLQISRRRLLPTTRAILAVLAEDRLTLSWRIRVMVWGLPWEEIAPELVRLAPMLHANALVQAQAAIHKVITRPDARLFEMEMALAKSEDEALRQLALVALIAQAGQAGGWSAERIARLQTYREDASAMVAEAAQFTFVS